MFTKRRRALMAVGSALFALLASLGLASPAHASTGTESVEFLHYVNQPYIGGASILPVTELSGNCRLEGQNQDSITSLYLSAPAGSADPTVYTLFFQGESYTVHTFFGDIWHATFVFRAANGSVILQWGADSPRMWGATTYVWNSQTTVTMSQFQVDQIASVDWIGNC